MGFNNPPRPTIASNSKGISIVVQSFQYQLLAEFELVDDAGKLGDSSSTECRMLRTRRGVSSS